MKSLTLVLTIAFVWQTVLAEELIPRSMAEKAEYYIVSVEIDGEYLFSSVVIRSGTHGDPFSLYLIVPPATHATFPAGT